MTPDKASQIRKYYCAKCQEGDHTLQIKYKKKKEKEKRKKETESDDDEPPAKQVDQADVVSRMTELLIQSFRIKAVR